MEIIIGKGTSLVSFGLTESETESKLGEPNKSFLSDFDCKRTQYFNHLLELSFEPENDNRLGWIEVHKPECELFGRKLIGIGQEEVLKFVGENCNEVPEIEDYGSMVSVTFHSIWLELQFEFGKCSNINLGVLYDENDNPVW